MQQTPKCYNSTTIAQIAFGVVGIDSWAQFTSKIKLQFFILVLPPPLVSKRTLVPSSVQRMRQLQPSPNSNLHATTRDGKWWMTTSMSFWNRWMKPGTLMACPLWWSSGRAWTGISKIGLRRWCKEDQVMMIQRVDIVQHTPLMLIGQQIRLFMKHSIRQHLFWQSDPSFRRQGLCFQASPSPQCSSHRVLQYPRVPTGASNVLTPMEVDAAHCRNLIPMLYRWCGESRHFVRECLKSYNVHYMMLDEWEGWIEHLSGADVTTAEAQCPTPEPPVALLETLESVKEDFMSCSGWTVCPCCHLAIVMLSLM